MVRALLIGGPYHGTFHDVSVDDARNRRDLVLFAPMRTPLCFHGSDEVMTPVDTARYQWVVFTGLTDGFPRFRGLEFYVNRDHIPELTLERLIEALQSAERQDHEERARRQKAEALEAARRRWDSWRQVDGRLLGSTPGTWYRREDLPDGTIIHHPEGNRP